MKVNIILLFIPAVFFSSCYKYLDKIPDSSLAIPNTIQGVLALMDNDLVTKNTTPGLGHLGTDDCLLTAVIWTMMNSTSQSAYTWQTTIYEGDGAPSWGTPYSVVYQSNVVLSALIGLHLNGLSEQELYKTVKGTALFTRAFQFYNLEETYGQPFKPASADRDQGILLRLEPDLHQKTARSTVRQVYDQMISDLNSALPLLPDSLSWSHRNRPGKAAALALLSRIYLSMQQYDSAGIYADSSLLFYHKLVDYNSVNPDSKFPFPADGNDEVLYQCTAVALPGQGAPALTDTLLYRSYEADDLRKTIFFRPAATGPGYYYKGSYSGTSYLFTGLSVDEVLLTRAECHARQGDRDGALHDLDTLLIHRYKKGAFHSLTAATADEALVLVLAERRKETLNRETRWADLRRLNQEERFAITLVRLLNGQTYSLPPEDPRYAYPIPEEEIQQDGIEQNPR